MAAIQQEEPTPAVEAERFDVSTVVDADHLRGMANEWNGLVERTHCTLPFLLHEWMVTWWETFRQERRLIKDSLCVKVVRRRCGQLVGIAPFMQTERPSFGPVRARTLGFLGSDEYVTEQRTLILDPAYEVPVARALAAHLVSEDAWDWVSWEGLDPASAIVQALQVARPLQWGRTETGNVLRLAATWEEFKSGLKRNIKESLRRCYNSVKREGLTPRFVVAQTPDEIAGALETFFRLHATRADQDGGVTHPDRFSGERAKRFLRTVCARLALRGLVRVFTLHIGDAPVATRIGFVLPECLYLYYSGFDPEWGKYSVMTTTVAEAIKYAIEKRFSRVHLSMGVDVSKSRWGPETPSFTTAVAVRPQVSSRAAFAVYSWNREHAELGRALARVLPKRRFD